MNTVTFNHYDNCPNCNTVLRQEWTENDGSVAVGSRIVGVVLRGVYDGVAYWQCPNCKVVWHRWNNSPGNARLRATIEKIWKDHKLKIWSVDNVT